MIQHRLNPNKFLLVRSILRETEALYKEDCCSHVLEAIDLSSYEKLIEELGRQIQAGELKPSDLDGGLIDKIYNDVSKPVKQVYGKKWIDYDYKEPGNLIQKFKKNLWQFSCAKTLTELEYINTLLLDKNGRIKPDHLFKADLKKANFQFNYNYINAEIQTAKRGAQMAHLWSTFVEQSHLYPNLVYRTVGDSRVRPEHEILNGTIKSIDDPFWKTYYPPNGWRCRCTVMNTAETATTKLVDDPTVKTEFRGNTALDEEIFSSKCTFFKLLNKDHKAKENIEYMKHNMPMEIAYHGKNKKKVYVSPFADPTDLNNNVESAMIIVDSLKVDVSIRAHLNVQKYKNPEYNINGKISDLKTNFKENNYNGILRAFESAKDQGCKSIAFDLTNSFKNLDIHHLWRKINSGYSSKKGTSFEEIIIVYKTKAIRLTREDAEKGITKKMLEKLKAN